ncbi:uncharacterized protein MYCGRDRAFT_94833 [Zymoseptoria tritici IPO323]|uniref:Uncharacterized protein n=1 Tax=Zymoseptoria tritici (strain CBS 115943 / IPO323) TaxID=336722 RepID=F9XFG0_ZYMTI|nr:uncharacterized protein MYCGRDRAFT_94833 [Zymoseptoria tritici IPO323]EGP85901.1 hypothetical protein MYCGRDRAFT_94833 [Zymoseptoria tritici IPO323]
MAPMFNAIENGRASELDTEYDSSASRVFLTGAPRKQVGRLFDQAKRIDSTQWDHGLGLPAPDACSQERASSESRIDWQSGGSSLRGGKAKASYKQISSLSSNASEGDQEANDSDMDVQDPHTPDDIANDDKTSTKTRMATPISISQLPRP